ncbi:hypothetical protein ACHAPJ_009976 [Fusarium lateritium]
MHMVAQNRTVCDGAHGTCVCFFGTCGSVVRDVTTNGIDLADIAKVRCASCTVREDAVGDRHCIAPPSDHGDEQAREPSSESDIKNGLECKVGLSTGRWASPKSPGGSTKEEPVVSEPRRVPTVHFMFDPNNAEKLREATQKFATLKSSFLVGKSAA